MFKRRRFFALSSILALCAFFFGITASPVQAFTSSDANTAMQTYVNTLYDANAKYFYREYGEKAPSIHSGDESPSALEREGTHEKTLV